MRFTNCTTRKPLFHEQCESNESYGSWTCIYTITPSNDLRFTNCTTRKPLFHHPYESNESCGKEDAIIRIVSVRVYWTTLIIIVTCTYQPWYCRHCRSFTGYPSCQHSYQRCFNNTLFAFSFQWIPSHR